MYNNLWGNPEPGGALFRREKQPSIQKKGGLPMITYAELIQSGIFIVALVGLCYQIFRDKRK